jgi:hypothetical protein
MPVAGGPENPTPVEAMAWRLRTPQSRSERAGHHLSKQDPRWLMYADPPKRIGLMIDRPHVDDVLEVGEGTLVQLALFGIAIVASGFAGYASGVKARRRSRLPVYVMGFLITAVILLILDLDRPGAGFIEVSQQPMADAAASIAAFPE